MPCEKFPVAGKPQHTSGARQNGSLPFISKSDSGWSRIFDEVTKQDVWVGYRVNQKFSSPTARNQSCHSDTRMHVVSDSPIITFEFLLALQHFMLPQPRDYLQILGFSLLVGTPRLLQKSYARRRSLLPASPPSVNPCRCPSQPRRMDLPTGTWSHQTPSTLVQS